MTPRRPASPFAVLAAALVLPGAGQVWLGQPLRGLTFVMFILLLGAATMLTAPPEASAVGRAAGGIFVWSLSVLDAWRTARLRAALHAAGRAGA